jgi:hypothetical protein
MVNHKARTVCIITLIPLLTATSAAQAPSSEEKIPLPREEPPARSSSLPPAPAVAPPLTAAPTGPVPRQAPVLLHVGEKVMLRVCQMLPADGLSAGERLLNSRMPLQPGDRFLAEVIAPLPPHPVLVGGTVTNITRPGWFGRPGYVTLQMSQLVQTIEGQTAPVPWQLDLADRRFATRMRRVLLTALFGAEGIGAGASVGAQMSSGNMGFIGGGMGIGLLVGLGYASFQRGTEASLEPGDTFEIAVGSMNYRPVSREWQTILYPAVDPTSRRRNKP